ncbi:unnamed protein product [Cuscuta campestris]|uniref:F-box domain-containing protein n=1 Tax=Cuscuta campestris TaxID=132261 RepID=A0A484LF25_9ASTE|nr:unnamed protein product [Cuscuta campestris]
MEDCLWLRNIKVDLEHLVKANELMTNSSRVDRLSCLPWVVLDNILGRLPIDDVAKMSVLSHMWKNNWKYVSQKPANKENVGNNIAFHISDRVLKMYKRDFGLITRLKFGVEDEGDVPKYFERNELSKKYFKGNMILTRDEVETAFLKIGRSKKRDVGDAVKLGLLHVLEKKGCWGFSS